ncbi:S8 family serine peptidase [Actinoplanes sp. NEAU-A12]|uniref:S8 family serine peptidase n=1 Tax=Actinoplanes sandaracinus TaxID=3045177 RepID=A0ABT6WFJ7_9ACTN|nr:S8 family serine peptidase [Actinoplanes sandaracinus]MDI6098477.1 S8 family serine peptidase [Actinoplanes sandaracinus]
MKSTHRRIVVGLVAVTALAAGASLAPVAGASVTGAARALPVRFLVGLRGGVETDVTLPSLSRFGLAHAEGRGDSTARRLLGEVRARSIEVPGSRAAAVKAALQLDPNVAYVQEDPQVKKLDVTPSDPYFTAGRQPELGQITVPKAWESTTGSSVKVAVVDTGVNGVGDLAGRVLPGYDFYNGDGDADDDDGHGTIVASLVAATPNNGTGIAGVCGECQILPVKVLDSSGLGYHSDIARGIIYAAQQGSKIINLSLGSPASSAVLQDAVAYANGRGALVVAAAGNDGRDVRGYPAAYADVLAVGATDTRTGGTARADFSNFGNWVDVAAPGITAGMKRDGTYCWDDRSSCWIARYNEYEIQGTSFSAPLVSGVAALVASKNPGYSGWSLGNAITGTARPNGGWNQYGVVDAAAAINRGTDTTPPSATGTSPAQNAKVRGTVPVIALGLRDDSSGILAVDLFVDGKLHTWDYTAPFVPNLRTAGRNGRIKMQVRIRDKAGNVTWLPARTVIADNVLPTASVTKAPKNKARVKGTVKVHVKAADKSGISKVQLLVNGKVVATDTKAGYVLSYKVSRQKKTMKVRIRAYDKAGNVRYTTIRTYYRA